MRTDPIRGKTIVFHFDDGPMKGKAYAHTFRDDGTVTYGAVGGATPSSPVKYEIMPINDEVVAVSYLSGEGYTLTAILDLGTHALNAVASNEKMLAPQHGTFEVAESAAQLG